MNNSVQSKTENDFVITKYRADTQVKIMKG